MLKLLIVGPNGAMGRALVKRAAATSGVDLIAGIGPKDRAYIGMDLGLLVGLGREIGGDTIAVLRASNASPIVHLLYSLIRTVSQEVGADADIDIIEMHSSTKLDAPSGTAKEIGQIIAHALGRQLDEIAEHGREGLGKRDPHTIQFSAIRSGGIPSTHKVIFGFQHERLELTHHAYTMEAFASGLIKAVLFVSSKGPGYFTLDDVL